MKKIFIKSAKIAAWIMLSLLLLFTLLTVLIQLPPIQNRIVGAAVEFLEDKIESKVKIQRVEIGFPKKLIVKGFYLESQEKDTLVYLGELAVDFRFFKLLNNTIDVQSIVLNDFVAKVKRDSLQRFNFDYIIDAFASEEKEPKEEKKPFAIALNKIHLNNIALSYDDKYEGNDLHLKLNEFSTKIEEFDLEEMNFSLPKIELRGLTTNLKRALSSSNPDDVDKEDDTKKGNNTGKEDVKAFKLKLKEIALSDINLAYEDAIAHLSSELNLKSLSLNIENIDLPQQEIKIDKIAVSDTQAAVRFLKNLKSDEKKEKKKQSDAENENPWKVKLNKLELKRLSVQFDDENAIALNKGMDFKHLNFSSINMEMKDFVFEPTEISGAILSATIKEKSGFDLQALKTDFKYGSQTAFLKNLHLKTANTNIQNDLVLTYAKQRDLTDNQGEIGVDLDFKNSNIGLKDILLFAPDLEKQDFFKNYSDSKISTSLRAKGRVKDLEIKKFYAKLAESTLMDISGRVKGLPNTEETHIDLKIKDLKTTAKNLQSFVPKESLPENIQLPENLSAEGFLKGYLNHFDTQIELKSSFGAVAIAAQWDQRTKDREKYSVDATANNFELGELMQNDSLAAISIKLQATGEGLKPQTANANFSLNLSDATFNNYHYKDFLLSGSVNEGKYSLQGGLKDPNLNFSLNAQGQLNAEETSLQLKADIEKVDLLQLKLNPEAFALKAKIRADFQNLNPDKLQGELAIEDLAMSDGKEIFDLQAIRLKASSKAGINQINITSQVAEMEMQGKYQLTKLSEALNKSIAVYFDLNQKAEKTSPKKDLEKIENQELMVSVLIKDNPLLHQMLPNLNNFEQFELKGTYLSKENQLQLQAKTSSLGYNKNKITDLLFNLDTEAEALKYKISLLQLEGESFEINKLSLAGEVQKNILSYNLELKDDKDSVKYLIAGVCERVADQMQLKLLPKGFKLNYHNWTVAPDNRIIIAKEGINAQQFELLKNGSKIKLQSQSEAANSPLKMEFVNFDFQELTEIIKKDTDLAKGFINGEIELRNVKEKTLFVSDLKLKQLEVMGAKVGNLSLKVDNNSPNRFNADIALSEHGNELSLKGFYDSEQESFDMDLDIKEFQIRTIEALTDKMISNAEGSISGKLAIGGKISKPSIIGKIQFNKVGIHVLALNADFKNINDAIEFTSSGIVVNRFEITDSKQNKLAIDGRISTVDYRDYAFDLNVLADNFKAINSTEKDNDLFYGELFLALNLKLTGDLKKPELNGKIGINKNSNLTLVVPHQDPSVADREGVVEFLDQRNQQLVQTLSIKNSVRESDFKGMDVAVAIHTDEEAQFNVIVDKANGDMLKLNGEADLTGGIDPSGKISLTGKYEFSKGSYEMSFNFIKRKFTIQKGSSIIWNGDPTAATLNLTAVYNVKAAPIDLLDKQISGLTPALKNMYKQKLPFETLLMMKGELLQPEISFDIKLGETSGTVSSEVISNTKSKLEQLRLEPSDLNKQIFALLILSRFIGENPFSGESSSAESIARESVSKILSEQLNQLAGNLIGGVEMNFDLQSTEDYSSGQKENRTDLNVGLSKKLLNDRLKITIGSSFGLEGSERENEKSSNIAGDISAEYLLSKDGRYMLRVYRKNKYQVALQGQIVETGVGFIITMSYERFKEIFEAKREKKEMNES